MRIFHLICIILSILVYFTGCVTEEPITTGMWEYKLSVQDAEIYSSADFYDNYESWFLESITLPGIKTVIITTGIWEKTSEYHYTVTGESTTSKIIDGVVRETTHEPYEAKFVYDKKNGKLIRQASPQWAQITYTRLKG